MNRQVITLHGWTPEHLAYAIVRFSRSRFSIIKNLLDINKVKTEKFLNTTFHGYGHASIADCAHIPMAIEDIPQLHAFFIEDQQLWDGQERSTRYQDFDTGEFFIPREISGTHYEPEYASIAESLYAKYRQTFAAVTKYFEETYPCPDGTDPDKHVATIKARAFDAARYWLFGAIPTSIGQITSARVLERQISALMSSEYPDLKDVADQMKAAAVVNPPFTPDGFKGDPLAPTLIKYANPSNFLIETRKIVRELITSLGVKRLIPRERVWLHSSRHDLDWQVVANLIFENSDFGLGDIYAAMSNNMSRDQVKLLINRIMGLRPSRHDQLPNSFGVGHSVIAEVCIDFGAQRDLHRHRNTVQVHNIPSVENGFELPQAFYLMKSPTAKAQSLAFTEVGRRIANLQSKIGNNAHYLIPFAFRAGTVYRMSLNELVYISELRTGPKGHESYRDAAYRLWESAKMLLDSEVVNRALVTPIRPEDFHIR